MNVFSTSIDTEAYVPSLSTPYPAFPKYRKTVTTRMLHVACAKTSTADACRSTPCLNPVVDGRVPHKFISGQVPKSKYQKVKSQTKTTMW